MSTLLLAALAATIIWGSVLLALSIAVGILGLRLTRSGLRGVRRGQTLCCAKCDYSLAGGITARCPECGADLAAPRAVIIGQRVASRVRLVIGAVGLAIGFSGFVPTAIRLCRAIPWYTLKPTSWVFQETESSEPLGQWIAVSELHRRYEAGRLTEGQVNRLAELLLAIQGQTDPAPFALETLFTLARLDGDGRLSAAQVERYVRQAHALHLDVRPIVISGDLIPARLRYEARTGHGLVFANTTVQAVRCDGAEVTVQLPDRSLLISGRGQWDFTVTIFAPGRHRLECDVRTWISRFDEPSRQLVEQPDHATLRTLSAEFEIVAEQPREPIKFVHLPGRDREIAASFRTGQFYATPPVNPNCVRPISGFHGWIYVQGPPVAVAFDVMVDVGDGSFWVGRIAAARDEFPFERMFTCDGAWRGILPPRVGIRLVPSADAARATVDLFEVYGDEVSLGPVLVSNCEQYRQAIERPAGAPRAATGPVPEPGPPPSQPATDSVGSAPL